MSRLDESALDSPGSGFTGGDADSRREDLPPLLSVDERPPFEVLRPATDKKIILVCDHASNQIPRSLNHLGIDEFSRLRHISWDIGAGDVTRFLAASLGATAVLATYSRLVVDCNRKLDDPTAFRAISDGDEVPGNHLLSSSEKNRRADAIFWPYHRAITAEIDRLCQAGVVPVLISIHSFTPFFDNLHRPWKIGVLWDNDPRIAVPLIKNLTGQGLLVGDNEPYSGRHPQEFTVAYQAKDRGLPHVSLEIRQDQLRDTVARRDWAARLADGLEPILVNDDLYQLFSVAQGV